MSMLQRLMCAFAVVVMIGAAQGLLMIYNFAALGEKVALVATKPIAGVDNARAAWSAYRDARSYLANFLEMTRPQDSKAALAEFDAQVRLLTDHLDKLAAVATSREASEKLNPLKEAVAQWADKARVLLGAAPTTSIPAPHALARMEVGIRNNLDELVALALKDAGAIRADVEASIVTVTRLGWLLIAMGAMVGAALAFASSLAISRPLIRLAITMRRLAEGDLSVTVTDKARKDEIGRMAEALEVFRANAAEVRRLEERTRESERTAAGERRALLASVAQRFKSQVAGVITQVLETIAEVARAAEAMSTVAEETRRHVGHVLGESETASHSIGTVAAATEEMAAASGEIAQRSDRSHHVASDAVTKVEASGQVISSLTDATGKIGKIVDLIGDIAAQTNLLALNATIEAARAGAAGRGFAVVASEVKTLADQTAKATGEISAQIAQVQETTKQAAHVMNAIHETIRSIDASAAEVANAIDNQRKAIADISHGTQLASTSAAQVAGTLQALQTTFAGVGQASGDIRGKIGALGASAQALRAETDQFLRDVLAA
jgi:methyl-accepting chemotaxis protein